MTVNDRAYAKINLFLDVISRRSDGFHNIQTVMCSVDLCDKLSITASEHAETSVALRLDGRFADLPTDSSNLAVKAALRYLDSAGISARVVIELNKQIPVSAGLAGGSSDAAAVLRGMNKIFAAYSEEKLRELAASVGSDVPFCLCGGIAMCEGRGDIITPISGTGPMFFVLVIGESRVSTPDAYAALDKMFSCFDGSVFTGGQEKRCKIIAELCEGRAATSLFNVFEKAIIPKCPEVLRIKNKLISLGATASLMSGSGPSVFGMFDTFSAARLAAQALRSEGLWAFAARSVGNKENVL